MPSIFDTIFNRQPAQDGGMNGALPWPNKPRSMLDPIDDTPSARDTLAGLSAGLLSAGAPSPYPVDVGTVFGKAVAGANAANDEDKKLKRALVGSQVATAQDKIKQRQALAALLTDNNGTPAPVAAADPTNPVGGVAGGGPSNPTNPGNLANGQGGFQQFKTPEEGVAAAIKLAQQFPTTYNGGQPMTLAQIESHWSPPDNGKDPMTKGNVPGVWSGNVARAMGTDPNTPIDFRNPAMGLAFAKAVHGAEHPPGSAYAPDVYSRGAQMAYGGQPSPIQPASAPIPQAPLTGTAVAQPPPVAQGDSPQAAPVPASQMAQAAPVVPPSPIPGPPTTGAPAAQNIRQVIQNLKPAERQLLATMAPDDVTKFLLQRSAPDHATVLDTTDGTVKFVDKTDPLIGTRYQPVDAAKLAIDMRKAAAEERQAAARELNAQGENVNRPLMVGPNGEITPSTQLPAAKAAVTSAEAKATQDASLDADAAKTLVTTAVKEFTEKERPKAMAIQEQIPQLHNIRRAIEAGAITGSGTTARNALSQLASTLGFKSTEAEITPSYIAGMAQQILANAKALGANPSNTEDKIIGAATGANPDTSKEGVLRLLDVQESLLRKVNDRYNTEAERIKTLRGVKSAYPDDYFKLPQPPTYEQWSKDNPLPPTASGAGAAPLDNEGTMNAADRILQERRKKIAP